MKRTHFSFMEEIPSNDITSMTGHKIPVFSGKRSKHGGDGRADTTEHVVLQNMCAAAADMSSGSREKLKRHQEEVARGNVAIPDSWGQEEMLKDWIDFSQFDALLVTKGLLSAREALAMEGRRRATN